MQPEPFGRYLIIHKLATGGMGEVLLARQSGPGGFDRFVAIKRLLPHLAENAQFVQMFLDEARLAARLTHPNICQIHEFGCNDGSYYLAMEYLSGESLSAVLEGANEKGKPLAHGIAAYIVAHACEGLHYAHERTDDEGKPLQLVHRDVSPSNLFLTYDGNVKLLDFGIAKAANRIAHTNTGSLKGKFGYIAPEAYQGAELDRRTDIFSMGVVLWEMLAKKRLYKREAEYLVGKAIVEEPPPDPRGIDPSIPAPLAEIALRALAKKPGERFQTALEMRRALTAFLRTLPDEVDSTSITGLMEDLFGELMATRKVVLDRLREESSQISDLDALEATRVTSTKHSPLDLPRNFVQPVTSSFGGRARKRRRRWFVVGGATAVAVALAGGWALFRPHPPVLSPGTPPVPPAAIMTTVVPQPAPPVAPTPVPEPVKKASAPPVKPKAAHPKAKPAAPAPPAKKKAFNPDAPVNPWATP
jgi:serine/threonine-protein kinase